VYDMYPWDKPASPGGRPPQTPPSWGEPSPQPPRPSLTGVPAPRDGGQPMSPGPVESAPLVTQALQFALDRRDNGGDTLSAAGQAPARPTRQ
jgi:hypothetical protein